MERLILDTTVLMAAERAGASTDEVVGDDDDVAMAAVTVAELLGGVQLADSRHERARRRYVDALIDTIPIEPYDLEVARTHAALLAHTHREGRPRGARPAYRGHRAQKWPHRRHRGSQRLRRPASGRSSGARRGPSAVAHYVGGRRVRGAAGRDCECAMIGVCGFR